MKVIEITTTQHVAIQHELADLKDRFLAWFIDVLILLLGIAFVVFGLSLIRGSETVMSLTILAVFLFYTLVQEVFFNGQTLGKRAMNLRVVKLSGKQASVTDYVIRWIFRSVDIYGSMGSVGGVLISSSDKSQRLGGMLSNTAVIKTRPQSKYSLADILKIDSLADYEPTYTDVRHFAEQDMILVKQTIDRYKRYPNEAHKQAVELLVQKLTDQLGIAAAPGDHIAFLRTVLTDYIVLTR